MDVIQRAEEGNDANARLSGDSLALDLIEPARPDIDRCILDLVGSHAPTRGDVTETRDGQCGLLPP